MKIIYESNEKLKEQTAVALGMFDGVHIGHREIISRAVSYAKENALASAVITLANHPRLLTTGKAPRLLTDLETRLKLFSQLGLDYALVLDFTPKLMQLSPEEYLQKYLLNTLHAKFISIGFDHHFGKDRAGCPKFLENWAPKNNCHLSICPRIDLGGESVSSSRIRELINNGMIEQANKLLGYRYSLSGKVIEGKRRGHRIGFPTANIVANPQLLVPKLGVYSAEARLGEVLYEAVVNIGHCPTFEKQSGQYSIEAHLLDFNRDIYGRELQIDFIERIRDEKEFDSQDKLIEQIKQDIETSSKSY